MDLRWWSVRSYSPPTGHRREGRCNATTFEDVDRSSEPDFQHSLRAYLRKSLCNEDESFARELESPKERLIEDEQNR